MMSKAKWFAVRKPSADEIIAISSQSDCPAEIPRTYKNVLYSPDPLSSCSVVGGSRDETSQYQVPPHETVFLVVYEITIHTK